MRKRALDWNDWDSLAAREWVRMGETGETDPEGVSVSVRVDLMEDFFLRIRGIECWAENM